MLLSSELGAYMWVWVEISVMKYRNIYQKRKIYNPVYWLYSFIWLINNTIDNNHCLDNLIQNIYVFEKTKPGTVLPFSGFHFCSILPFFFVILGLQQKVGPRAMWSGDNEILLLHNVAKCAVQCCVCCTRAVNVTSQKFGVSEKSL